MSVTQDDPRFDWPSRKPTKYAKEGAKFASAPTAYVAEQVLKKAHRKSGSLARSAGKLLGGGSTLAAAGAVTASLAILAAAYVVSDRIAKSQQLKLGERINRISLNFADAQKHVQAAFGARTWAEVPEDVRSKAVADYKRALGTATSQAQGSAFAGARPEGSYK